MIGLLKPRSSKFYFRYIKKVDENKKRIDENRKKFEGISKKFNSFLALLRKADPPNYVKTACVLPQSANPVWFKGQWRKSRQGSDHLMVDYKNPSTYSSETAVTYPLPFSMFSEYPGDLFAP